MRRILTVFLTVGFTASPDPFLVCAEHFQAPPIMLRVHPDAPGDDHQNRNGEFVVIESRVDSALFIGGWQLCDAAAHCFAFPAGRVLQPRDSVTIYTGSGEADSLRLYWGSGRAVWNNDGDVATVRTAAGVEVIAVQYGSTAVQPTPTRTTRTCCRVCRTGKACGDSCISRSYTCRKAPGCACNG